MTDKEVLDIYFFGNHLENLKMPSREEVGSKALNLIIMDRLDFSVPPGFVINTQSCREYLEGGNYLSISLVMNLEQSIREMEKVTGLVFGGRRKPLLVSVRSGAAVSMPGMMDTLLNIGLNNETVSSLIRMTGNPHFVWDSYRRLVQSFAEIVHDCPPAPFEDTLEEFLRAEELDDLKDLSSHDLGRLVHNYLEIFEEHTGIPFPQEPMRQLTGAVEAVFHSWESPRAREYRKAHDITGLTGTAVTVQSMVFGNMGSTSGSGVGFTRNPVTGDRGLYMDFLFNAQGEDVVSGRQNSNDVDKLAQIFPSLYDEIKEVGKKLEMKFGDMQDFEFTVQDGKLYMLQCRTGKRTPWAALKIAVDMVNEGLIDNKIALKRLEGYDLSAIKHTRLATGDTKPIASGHAANRGVVTGIISFDSESAQQRKREGKSVILVRDDTSTFDISGMIASAGILTRLGGRTSHASVIARQMDKVCIVGCRSLSIDNTKRTCLLGGKTFSEGDCISLDGNSGNVYSEAIDIVVERPTDLLAEVEKWKVIEQTSAPH